ncbi:MAG: M23 family metallopeptidase [Pseudomonadota bacterium]
MIHMLSDLLAALTLLTGATAHAETAPIPASCGGALVQGGLMICQGPEGSAFTYNGLTLTADSDGLAVFGLKRNAELETSVSIETPASTPISLPVTLTPRSDDYRVIKGLDCDKVDARTPEQKDHAARSWVIKQDAFASFNPGPGPATGFVLPADGPPTSPFGPTRKYIGVSAETGEACESTSVHRGYDMATPIGTPVTAPAAGTVILSDPDLYYEGGAVFLDHGHGLVSVFIHLSSVDVAPGDTVERGDLLAKTGNTGRTTGPHLHWAVKWRNPASDSRDGDFYIDPALLLDLAP